MHSPELLFVPVIAMLALMLTLSSVLRTSDGPLFSEAAFCFLFGSGIVIAMTFPIQFGQGIIFDLRSLLLGLCVVFAGWRPALFALTIAVLYRAYLGGAGMVTGIAGLLFVYCSACLWDRYLAPKITQSHFADIGLGLAVSAGVVAVVFLPQDVAMAVLRDVAPVLTVFNILGALAIGFVLRRQIKFFADTQKLRNVAMLDPLTNLLNRRGAEERLKKLRIEESVGRAMLCFDLDHFKQINDTYGHEAGDLVLTRVTERIKTASRGDVIFSRQGGDEFTVFVPGIDSAGVATLADRLCAIIAEKPVTYAGEHIDVTISMGVYWTCRTGSYDEMLRMADAQLLVSKRQGRNCATVLLDPESMQHTAQSGRYAVAV